MNCELAHERIVMAAYGELADELAHELERHLAGCEECGREQRALAALKTLADINLVVEPDANLVARSRIRLEEALDALPPRRWYERVTTNVLNGFASMQAAPVAAVLLLIAGGGAGCLGGYEFALNRAAHLQTAAAAQAVQNSTQNSPMEVANISSIVRKPNSEMVEVNYNQTVPRTIQGTLDDPAIRQLLMLASEDTASENVRGDSVGLLAAECRAGHGCQPDGIRDALMVSLRYDRDAGVRRKALEGLSPYVAEDMRVRDAVLESLMNDNDARIRSAAINVLEPVEADTSVRQVLYSVAASDSNQQIRNVSRTVLSREPEIQ